ncbi:MAG: hypothetical protein KDE27_13570, partial [Planctomycetes bacterium]|nr:hypothetical protein [Planctomycetota bacterium]
SEPMKTDRPERYASSWGQFALDTYTDPRQLSILRLGAGAARPAEYHVFEWVDEGRRLRALHHATLRTEWVPWSWRAVGSGRYLVTFDDRFEPQGTSANTVVLYDLVRDRSERFRADDFLPAPWLVSPSRRGEWQIGPSDVDPLLHRIYPSSPDAARDGTCPFLVLDLPSLSVRVLEQVPARLPERVYSETEDGHAFEWEFSMGDASEPNWLLPAALPTLLKARRVRDVDDARPFGGNEVEAVFRREAETGDYVRCDASEWKRPPDSWGAAK